MTKPNVYIACGYTDLRRGIDGLAYRYLTWLMQEALILDLSVEDQAARLLPVNAPEECRVIKGV